MNTNSLICRFFNKSRKLYSGHGQFRRIIQQTRTYSASSPITEILKEKDSFQHLYPGIIESLTKSPKFQQNPEVKTWIKKMLDYNLHGGKKTRGLMTVLAYETMEKPENITEESLTLARTLGWCVEIFQAYLIVLDDIMDGSTTRRGVTCWYRLPNVGLGALNDAVLMYCSIFETLKANFENSPQYSKLFELFNETLFLTSIGQHLDFMMAHRNKNDYSLFTIERYNAIVKYKTSYYTIKMPVIAGMFLVKNPNTAIQKDMEEIFFELGNLYQMQDDFIDCFGVESITGKAGTDIQEGKCTWLAATALQRFSEAQRNLFIDNYGSKELENVDSIKRLYEEVELRKIYAQEEQAIYDSIVRRARALKSEPAEAIFKKLLGIVYKRKQ